MFAYNSETGGAIVSNFSGCPGMVLCAKIGACVRPKIWGGATGVMVRGQKIGIFLSSRDLAGHAQIGHCDGTAIGAHTGAGGQCTFRR